MTNATELASRPDSPDVDEDIAAAGYAAVQAHFDHAMARFDALHQDWQLSCRQALQQMASVPATAIHEEPATALHDEPATATPEEAVTEVLLVA